MKSDIILSGVGGQGIVSIAAIIGTAALENGLQIKQSEVHGMSQRGGAVSSHLRISDTDIASDLVPYGAADLILSVEPMECLRYLPYLSPEGWLVSNTTPFVNIDNYPEVDAIMAEISKVKNHITLDADSIAKKVGHSRMSNMVALGAALPFIGIPFEKFEAGIRRIFGRKGDEVVQMNIDALKAGREVSQSK
jgi:indolepyruvate ferredoxin oxidoreductase beta subunit